MNKEIVTFATMAIGILATCADAQQAIDSTSPASSGGFSLERMHLPTLEPSLEGA